MSIAKSIRRWLRAHPRLRYRLRRWKAMLPSKERDELLGPLMGAFGQAFPRACVIQVGANDGARYDPLRREILRRQWSGVLVEPVPFIYERLCANYAGHPTMRFENCAIAAEGGAMPFHYLRRDPSLPQWASGLGSFMLDVVLSHRQWIPDIENYLESTDVPCKSLDELCDSYALGQVDLLQIDTEGYDYEIVRMIDFERLRPRLIVFEHKHLQAAERASSEARLRDHGFELVHTQNDTVARHKTRLAGQDATLDRIWQQVAIQLNAKGHG